MIASTRLASFAVGGQHGHELGGEPARIVSGMARVRLAEAGELGFGLASRPPQRRTPEGRDCLGRRHSQWRTRAARAGFLITGAVRVNI